MKFLVKNVGLLQCIISRKLNTEEVDALFL